MILIPDGVILIPQRSPKIGGPGPDIWSASSTTTCRRGMRCGCGSVSVGGTREGGRGSWVLQTLRELSNPSPRATPPQSFSLLLPKVQRPGVTPRHSAFPLAGRHHHVLQQNSQSRQSVTRQNTHLKKENFGFPDCHVQNSSGTVTVTDPMVGKQGSSAGVVTRQ